MGTYLKALKFIGFESIAANLVGMGTDVLSYESGRSYKNYPMFSPSLPIHTVTV